MSQRIRIKLQSYDHNLVDKSAEKIVKTVRSTGAVDNRTYSTAYPQKDLYRVKIATRKIKRHVNSFN